MAPDYTTQPSKASKKRKTPPTQAFKDQCAPNSKRFKPDRRLQQRDVRALATQTSSKALKMGELDVDSFVKAREFEIRALEEGMSRSKKAQNLRAFQQVPRELRRRTASHNVKRVPKRLQPRARREMKDDNTPTVTARRRKLSSHQRLRLETARTLRVLGAKRKLAKDKAKDASVTVKPVASKEIGLPGSANSASSIVTRAPKIKKAQLAHPPAPKAKFKKRQFNKTWLPTHMFHSKRAHMTPPKQPLWRFALPLTPTAKSYRPTHRAVNERGAVVWDMSYMSTIGLEGQQRSVENVLKALGIGQRSGNGKTWTQDGERWRSGVRVLESFVFEREAPHRPIAPVSILWSIPSPASKTKEQEDDHRRRKLFIRVHPSAFSQLWDELVRLVKIVKPHVSLEDLRFEIGSIEIMGPSATEALLSALWPSPPTSDNKEFPERSVERCWKSLAGLTNTALLPSNVSLGFDVQDPRLHHPPQTITKPDANEAQDDLLELLASWPADQAQTSQKLFDRRCRVSASSALPSQKSVNRRKAAADPGHFPEAHSNDPRVPVLLYSMQSGSPAHHKWTVLLPWKCVQPVWYGIMYYPLATGGQPRFGGLQEYRQLAFEAGIPSFPADFPGTKAGWEWESEEREKRMKAWERLPKSRRVNWKAVDLGDARKGEIGLAMACDWHTLLPPSCSELGEGSTAYNTEAAAEKDDSAMADHAGGTKSHVAVGDSSFVSLTKEQVNGLLKLSIAQNDDIAVPHGLAHVRINLLGRGVPQVCARIYRLPHAGKLRERWLALHPKRQSVQRQGRKKHALPLIATDAPPHVVHQRLAQALLKPPHVGDRDYPVCPGKEDLIGFVTSGNFNLGEGQATGVGCILLEKVLQTARHDHEAGRLCVVRNAGNGTGRLAMWTVV